MTERVQGTGGNQALNKGQRFWLFEVGECTDLELASCAGKTTTTTAPDASAEAKSCRKPRLKTLETKLSQGERLIKRLIEAGSQGVLTVELFAGQYCAKYTGRMSEQHLKYGHDYECKREGTLPGSNPTEQHRYFYTGFRGHRDRLHPLVAQAMERWEQLRAGGKIRLPWEIQ